ncbi:unnamed protein product [Peniophora sp. CBMAI 1063]|nr:unnamed protein product [Peniophora sp. CBMAI 1063]
MDKVIIALHWNDRFDALSLAGKWTVLRFLGYCAVQGGPPSLIFAHCGEQRDAALLQLIEYESTVHVDVQEFVIASSGRRPNGQPFIFVRRAADVLLSQVSLTMFLCIVAQDLISVTVHQTRIAPQPAGQLPQGANPIQSVNSAGSQLPAQPVSQPFNAPLPASPAVKREVFDMTWL